MERNQKSFKSAIDMRIENLTVAIFAIVIILTTTTNVYASVDEQGAYDEGYADGYDDGVNGYTGEDVYCDSYSPEQDIWCEAYINGYEDGQQDAAQGE
jgi:hypothetical protein